MRSVPAVRARRPRPRRPRAERAARRRGRGRTGGARPRASGTGSRAMEAQAAELARPDRRAGRGGEPLPDPASPLSLARPRAPTRRCGRGSSRSSDACGSSRTTSPTAPAATARFPAGSGSGAMLPVHAGDPGRARGAALRRLGGPRALAAPARPARGPPRPEDRARGEPPGLRPPRPRRRAGAARPRPPPRGPRPRRRALQEPRARCRRSTTPSSRPASAATAWWWPSGAGSSATSPASPPPRGCAGWTGWGSPPPPLDGGQLDRRQGGDQPREGQEHDRGLPPAAGGRGRPRVPRHPARRASSGRGPTRS